MLEGFREVHVRFGSKQPLLTAKCSSQTKVVLAYSTARHTSVGSPLPPPSAVDAGGTVLRGGGGVLPVVAAGVSGFVAVDAMPPSVVRAAVTSAVPAAAVDVNAPPSPPPSAVVPSVSQKLHAFRQLARIYSLYCELAPQ
jgi:hypothetical protein